MDVRINSGQLLVIDLVENRTTNKVKKFNNFHLIKEIENILGIESFHQNLQASHRDFHVTPKRIVLVSN